MKKILLAFLAVIIIVSSSVCVCAKEVYKLGDANKDGSVNIIDTTYIQRYLAKMSNETEIELSLADVNGDNTINILDATMIQMYLAKLISKFPAENTTETTPSVDSDGYYDQIIKPWGIYIKEIIIMETYEKLLIDVKFISKEDVITTSSPVDDDNDHDNGFRMFSDFE